MDKKVVLITGASSGMGHVTARDLISQGHTVYCVARSVDRMRDLKRLGGKVLKVDVTKDSDLRRVVKVIIKSEKRIDVLWNNSGFGLYGPVEEIPLSRARYQFDVNLFGLARLTQLVLPHMRKQGSGLIINTSSMGGKMYTPLGAWYHATKHALEGWSDCLRLEVKEFGIKVVVLEPGLIDTGFGAGVMHNFDRKSLKGPYKRIINALLHGSLASTRGSPPSVISDKVQEIIASPNPKTRYVVGKMAKSALFVRKWFGDKFFDKQMEKMLK